MKTYSLEELTDKYIGKQGPQQRIESDHELRLDLLGHAIKEARKKKKPDTRTTRRNGGVKKAQVSKIENSATDARFSTILKVFKVLDATVKFNVGLNEHKIAY